MVKFTRIELSLTVAGALGIALFVGMPSASAQSSSTGGKNQNCIGMGGGAPSILKEEQRRNGNCVAMGGGAPSILKEEPKRLDGGFKVEIEGVTKGPDKRGK